MGIAKPALPSTIYHSKGHHPIHISDEPNSANSMSQDYHQGIFSFSNGLERAQQDRQHHIAHQIRRDKLRGFDPPPPSPPSFVAIQEEESGCLPGYESGGGMLSEMFSFASGGSTATELLESQIPANYRNTRPLSAAAAAGVSSEWYGNRQVFGVGDSKNQSVLNSRDTAIANRHQISSITADTAAVMQLFLMNPQPRSPSSSPSHPPPSSAVNHRLLPNPNPSSNSTLHGFNNPIATPSAAAGGTFSPSQLTWVPNSDHSGGNTAAQLNSLNHPTDISGLVEGQGLSLSLSSSLQHLEVAKANELRMGDGGILFFNQGGGGGSTSVQYPYKNLGGHNQALHLQGGGGGGVGQNHHQVHVGYGPSLGMVNVLRNSKYVKAAQELLEEFCSVGRVQFKKNMFGRHNTTTTTTNPNPPPSSSAGGGGCGGGGSSSTKDLPPLSAADRIEHQRRKVKLLSMLDEVDRRYNHYCEQMQMVVNSFDLVMGFGAAVPYTALAQKAMSRHFRCLKDAVTAQLKHSCELLGEKDAGTSGVTKGETPRLKLLEQSLRQQRAFHQMGMMEQEAWRPQRGLPERSVNILRAWLFEHFLHPYPSDADKHHLARQTGLSRNQVSNWFINARVRLWKPMVEEMYQQEAKEDGEVGSQEEERPSSHNCGGGGGGLAQTPTPLTPTATVLSVAAAAAAPPVPPVPVTVPVPVTITPSTVSITATTAKRSQFNELDSDPSVFSINSQCFSEFQSKHATLSATAANSTAVVPAITPSSTFVLTAPIPVPQPALSQSFPAIHEPDTCRRGRRVGGDPGNRDGVGSTRMRFGTAVGDVSLTLGLRHAGNLPEKSSPFSIRDFGAS